MEIKDRGANRENLKAGDVRLPEVTGFGGRGPSRTRVVFHIAGMGLGFLLLLVGMGLGFSRGMWDKLALFPVIIGAALVAGWITVNYRFLREMLKNRRVLVGTNAIFMALLAMVLLVIVNFVSFRHYQKWDLTEMGENTLSQKTANVLASLEDDITIIVCDRAANPRGGLAEVYERLMSLLKLYEEESTRIKVEILSPDTDPEKAKLLLGRHGVEASLGALGDDVFVVRGDRVKNVKMNAMMEWRQDPSNPFVGPRPTVFKGEGSITSAVLAVMEDAQTKLYVLVGHGEKSISDGEAQGMMEVASALKRDNFALEELAGIPSLGVPEDCDCLIILGPRVPLASAEVDSLGRYLARGGRVFVSLDYGVESGLEGLLARWGVRLRNDVVISLDANTRGGSPAAIVTMSFGDHEIVAPLRGFMVVFNFTRSIAAGASPIAEVTPLVTSSRQSYSETDIETLQREQISKRGPDDTMGPLVLGVAVQEVDPRRTPPAANARAKARMVVFGDTDVFSNGLTGSGRVGNLDLCRNSINWLVERKDLIAIEPRPEKQHILVVDDAGKRAVFWLMVVGLPLVVLLMGGLVWALRSYGSR